jgi:hypothetical protein
MGFKVDDNARTSADEMNFENVPKGVYKCQIMKAA